MNRTGPSCPTGHDGVMPMADHREVDQVMTDEDREMLGPLTTSPGGGPR